LPVDKSGRVYLVGSMLHPEVQTVDEMLDGWRNQSSHSTPSKLTLCHVADIAVQVDGYRCDPFAWHLSRRLSGRRNRSSLPCRFLMITGCRRRPGGS
jgi:hypothetical protein